MLAVAFALAVLSTGAMLGMIRARSLAHRTHVRNEQQTESRWVQCVANIVADFRLIAGYAGSREREIGRSIAQYTEYWKKLGGRVVFEGAADDNVAECLFKHCVWDPDLFFCARRFRKFGVPSSELRVRKRRVQSRDFRTSA